jgi:hypothetical protein
VKETDLVRLVTLLAHDIELFMLPESWEQVQAKVRNSYTRPRSVTIDLLFSSVCLVELLLCCLTLHAMQGLQLGRLHARCCRCYCLAVILASAMCCAFTPCFTPIQGHCCFVRAPIAHATAQPYVHRRGRLLRCSAEPQGAAVASAQASLQLQQFSDESTSPGAAQVTASRSKYNKRRRARSKRLAGSAASADSPDNEVASQTTLRQQQQQQQQTLQATRDARVSEPAAQSAAAAPQADAPRGSRTKHTLSPLQQNSTTTTSSSRAQSAASSGKKQIRMRPFEQRNKGTSSRPRRSSNNSTSSSSTSSSSSSSGDSTSILGSRAKDTSSSSSSSSLKELENSFERVIRALSKPVTAAALQASLDGSCTSSTAAASSNAATLAEAAKKKVETTMDAAARAASKRSRRKSSTTATSNSKSSSISSINPSVGDSPTVKTGSNTGSDSTALTDSSSSSSSSSGSISSSRSGTVGGITSTGRIEPPLRVDPPQRYVEVIYNRRARDVFTWITTNSESFGTVLSHDQASRMNKRSRISWLLQVSEVLRFTNFDIIYSITLDRQIITYCGLSCAMLL